MRTLKSNIFFAVAVLLSMPSLAWSRDSGAATTSALPAMQQHLPFVVYRNGATETQLSASITVNRIPDEASAPSRVRLFRPERLEVVNSHNDIFTKNDHASLRLLAPTQAVNGALSFIGTAYQTPLDSSVTKLIQVLSLAATRKINAEFAYSAPLGKSGTLDSILSCKLHPVDGSGRPVDMLASLQYKFKF